jgi:hypothetical protein
VQFLRRRAGAYCLLKIRKMFSTRGLFEFIGDQLILGKHIVSPLLQSVPSLKGNVLDHWVVFFGQTS